MARARAEADVAAVAIEQAQAQIAAAEAERDQYRAQGSMEEKWMYAVHDYQVQAAREGLAAAEAQKVAADRTLAALEALRDNPLALLSQVNQAEGQAELAAAAVAVAEARLRELRAGPRPEEVAMAQAQVAQAQAALRTVETQIAKMALTSPHSGVVTSRSANEGEAALAGTTLLTVADLDEVKLTIYVPEDELDSVYIGQEVEVRVDSFPGRAFPGTVASIAQQAEFTAPVAVEWLTTASVKVATATASSAQANGARFRSGIRLWRPADQAIPTARGRCEPRTEVCGTIARSGWP